MGYASKMLPLMGKIMINQRILRGTQHFPTNPALCRGFKTYGKHSVSGHPSVGIKKYLAYKSGYNDRNHYGYWI
jgi:hypothetical protein